MHTCPDCGQACHCNGDIDDIECDSGAAEACTHCNWDEHEDANDSENPQHDLTGGGD